MHSLGLGSRRDRSNDDRYIEACKLFGHILGQYLNGNVARCQFATTRNDDGSMVLEDLAALPDLSAGALAELVSWMANAGYLGATGVLAAMGQAVPAKARCLAGWLADSRFHSQEASIYYRAWH